MEEEAEVVIVTNVYGDVCIRKARRKRQKLLVRELMYDYANNTTLHGLPYVTRTGLTLIEKLFWLITFLVSVSLCLFLISKVWFKWQTSPVIVTVSEQLVPVSMVPFPSVTICPQSKCKVSVYNYTDIKVKLDAFILENKNNSNFVLNETMIAKISKFKDISRMCDANLNDSSVKSAEYKKDKFYSLVDNLLEVSLNHTDIFDSCTVNGINMSCEDLFVKVLTKEGVCYNMNSLPADEIFRKSFKDQYRYINATTPSKGWTMENGYNTSLDGPFYPIPGTENGAEPNVVVILRDKLEERDKLCNAINTGFKIFIQHPTDLPQSSLYYYAVLNGQVSSMALSFSILNTSESLRGYDPEVRQCYFPDERYLQYFSLYTATNCRIECLSNISREAYGCVDFYMPHDSNTPICKYANMSLTNNRQVSGSEKCHCLPSCNGVDYEAEILKTDFKLKEKLKTYAKINNSNSSSDFKGLKLSKLEMYYKRPRYLSMRRSELFGLIDFLANCGGLLGLFLGFSFLSLVEIFYFLTLRLCCTLKKDLEEEKATQKIGKEIHIDKY